MCFEICYRSSEVMFFNSCLLKMSHFITYAKKESHVICVETSSVHSNRIIVNTLNEVDLQTS